MVEAAIVLPIFILIIASLVSICIYYFGAMRMECRAKVALTDSIRNDKSIAKVISVNDNYSSQNKGFHLGILKREYSISGYVIDQEAIIRAGEFTGIKR